LTGPSIVGYAPYMTTTTTTHQPTAFDTYSDTMAACFEKATLQFPDRIVPSVFRTFGAILRCLSESAVR
jgi:hypothetical protein